MSIPSGEDAREKEGADLIYVTHSTDQVLRYAGLELARHKEEPYVATLRITGGAREVGGRFVKNDKSIVDIDVGEETTGTVTLDFPDGRTFSKPFASQKVQILVYRGRQRPFDEYRDFAPVVAEHIGRAFGIQPLLAMLKGAAPDDKEAFLLHDAERLRAPAAIALGNIGDPKAVEPLMVALRDAQQEVLKPRPTPTVITDFDRVDPGVLLDATIIALGKLRDARAVEALAACVKATRGLTYFNSAAIALGKMHDRRAVEPLISAFEFYSYPGYDIQHRESAEALKEITGQDFGLYGSAPRQWKEWWSANRDKYPSRDLRPQPNNRWTRAAMRVSHEAFVTRVGATARPVN